MFQNESIWPGEQIMEPLYMNTTDGKSLRPWLATGYSVSKDGKSYTFNLRPGVKFSNGTPMTSADVKFSIDQARANTKGWGYIDAAIKSVAAPTPSKVVITLKYPWAPFLSDISLFAERGDPQELRRRVEDGVLQAPGRYRPLHVGQARRRLDRHAEAQPELLAEG